MRSIAFYALRIIMVFSGSSDDSPYNSRPGRQSKKRPTLKRRSDPKKEKPRGRIPSDGTPPGRNFLPKASTDPRLTYSKNETETFIKLFKKEGKTNSERKQLKDLRTQIYQQTKKIVKEGYYFSTETNSTVNIVSRQENINKFYTKTEFKGKMGSETTVIEVIQMDTFDAGKELLDKKLSPVILNMANAYRSGGGVEKGAGAQEECLFRRSDYFLSLNTTKENIAGDFDAHYNPNILVFRAQESEGYKLLEKDHLFEISGIAVAAPDCVQHKKAYLQDDDKKLTEKAKTIFRNKIRTILGVALENEHKSVVLGALGAGAFGCPCEEVSAIFKKILPEFNGSFKKIVFAVLNDINGKSNYEVFQKEFSSARRLSSRL